MHPNRYAQRKRNPLKTCHHLLFLFVAKVNLNFTECVMTQLRLCCDFFYSIPICGATVPSATLVACLFLKNSPSWNVVFFFLPTAPFSVTKCIFSMATRPVGSAAFQDIRRFRTCSCQTEVTTLCIFGSNDQERLV